MWLYWLHSGKHSFVFVGRWQQLPPRRQLPSRNHGSCLVLKKKNIQIFNVGSGKAYSIQEIADAISDNQVYIDKRSGEMQTTFADITKIGEVIGWKPEIDVIDWIHGQEQISI